MISTEDLQDAADSRRKLAQATDILRGRVSTRAVQVANDVLTAALRSTRRGVPIRALADHDRVLVSDQILIRHLVRQIDAGVAACSVGRIFLRADRDGTLTAVTIELFVQYGEVLMETADRVRRIAGQALVEVLGEPTSTVELILTHVHVSDVTVGDPHLVNPEDEATVPR